MQTVELVSKRLIDQALEGGATAAKIISARDVFVAQWVRQKCQYGCRHFGKSFTCPPYCPSPQETAEVLQHYQQALLVQFANRHIDDPLRNGVRGRQVGRPSPQVGQDDHHRHLIHRLLFNLERQAFLDGFYGAVAYAAGPCRLCPECPAEKLENPSLFYKKDCLNPKMARPSMEAAGIDVYKTVRQAGWEIHVVREKTEAYTSFGLVLLE